MTDDVLPPESQFEQIARRRQELRLSLGLSPIAPRQVLTTFVGTLTSQFMSMMAGQPQKSPEQHDAQNQAQGNNGGFGGFLSRFPRLQNRGAPPSVEPPKDPNQPPEGTIEYWTWLARGDVEPQYGTKEHAEWDRRQNGYRGHIFDLTRGHQMHASVDTGDRRTGDGKSGSSSVA